MKDGMLKRNLVNLYNSLYDIKLDIQLFIKWRKDIKLQNKLGLPQILSIDDTLDMILEKQCSICRYGDGEFKLMDGEHILFQEENRRLGERLKEVIYSDKENVLICIPTFLNRKHSIFLKGDKKTLTKEEKKRIRNATRYTDNILAERRKKWYEYFDMDRIYGNSLISRFYAGVYDDDKSQRWIKKWKKLWQNRYILIVEGDKTRLGVGNDLFDNASRIRRILAPNTSAFSVYDKILETVRNKYEQNEIVLIALGPTATVLSYDLAIEGIWALDVGHLDIEYEWFLRKDRTHQKIEGKFVSEAQGGSEVSEVNEKDYKQQIIYEIDEV